MSIGIALERRVVALCLPFLVHQAQGSVGEGEEAVVVGVETVAVAWETPDEQLQLVVGSLADVDALAAEDVLQVVGGLLHVTLRAHARHEVEVGIDELLAFPGDDLLHGLDVLDGHLVVGVRNARVSVLLLVQHGELALLVGCEEYLVVDEGIDIGDAVYLCQQVNGHDAVVDGQFLAGAQDARQSHGIDIKEAVDLALTVAEVYLLAVHLEVCHADSLVLEVQGEVAVHVVTALPHVKELRFHAAVVQLVDDLADLHEEVFPLGDVEGEQRGLALLLGDD